MSKFYYFLYLCFLLVSDFEFIHANQNKPLVYCLESEVETLDPHKVLDSSSSKVTRNIYDRLVDFGPGASLIEPSLAEKWEVSKDQKIWTLHLRKNVSFHENIFFTPKRNFNSQDVIFTFERLMEPKNPWFEKNGFFYFDSFDFKTKISKISAIDEHTVQIEFNTPFSNFINYLALDTFSILSKEYSDHLIKLKKKENFHLYPVGTGPFKFMNSSQKKSYELDRFEKSWHKNFSLPKIMFIVKVNEEDRYQSLYANKCDIVSHLSSDRISEFQKKDSPISIFEKPGLNIIYLSFNLSNKKLNNIKFRQAVSMALNRKKYVNEILNKNTSLALNVIPPFVSGFNEQVKQYKYDLDNAKKIILDLDTNESFELLFNPESRGYFSQGQKLAEEIQKDLSFAGLKVNIKAVSSKELTAQNTSHNSAFAIHSWISDLPEADAVLSLLLSCNSIKSKLKNWCSREFDDLLLKAQQSNSSSERTRIYRNALLILREEIPVIPIGHSKVFKWVNKSLKNYKISPMGYENFQNVRW